MVEVSPFTVCCGCVGHPYSPMRVCEARVVCVASGTPLLLLVVLNPVLAITTRLLFKTNYC